MISLPNPLKSAAIARPDHPAVIEGDRVITYRALAERAARIAAQITEKRVALIGPPSIEWIAAFHGIGWAGATVVPLPFNAPSEVVRAQMDAAGVEEIFSERQATIEMAERFWPLEEPRALFFTSGSSGKPRPIVIDTSQIVFSAFGSTARIGHALDDRWLACLPLHHVGGASILWRAALLGISVIIEPRFDAERVAQLIDSGSATIVSLVPAMLERVFSSREHKPFPPALRAILLGGDRAPEALLEKARKIKAPIALTWGMTECASQIATTEPGDFDRAGLPPLSFARVDAPGGVLAVRGPIARGGCSGTRDTGEIRDDGTVLIKGRRDAVFISGGEKVDPARVEAVLESHPAIASALVFGRADTRWGRRAEAMVVAREEPIDVNDLIAWCRARLDRAEVPAHIRWVDMLPTGASGKPSRIEAEKELER